MKDAASAYLTEEPCIIIVEQFPGMEMSFGTRAMMARIQKPVPFELSAAIGDIVHNLRSALDLLACDLVRLEGKSIRDVHFPFCDGPSGLDEMIKKRNLHRAGADVVAVVKSLKPYKGGNIALRAVHDMDVADKHQALLPVIGAVTLPLGKILNFHPETPLQEISTIIVKDGQLVVGLPNYANVPALGTKLPARFFLAFSDAPGIGNREVFEALHDLTKATNSVFDALTALRPGAAFPSAAT